MWDPRRLTTLWVFTACYRDRFSFTEYVYPHLFHFFEVVVTLGTGILKFKSERSIQFLPFRFFRCCVRHSEVADGIMLCSCMISEWRERIFSHKKFKKVIGVNL
jgi:hypothetical protein